MYLIIAHCKHYTLLNDQFNRIVSVYNNNNYYNNNDNNNNKPRANRIVRLTFYHN